MSNILYENQVEYLTSLRNQLDPLLKEMEKFAAEKKIPILD